MEITQVSFVKGEVSPIAADRTDEAFYANALNTCVNFFIRAEGGATNRPGLQFVGNCSTNAPNGSYLLPFIYNNQQTYVTEFAAGSIKLYSNGVFVQNAGTEATITNVAVAFGLHVTSMTFTAVNTFTAGQTVTVAGVVSTGGFSVNGLWTLSSATSSQFVVTIPGAGGGGTFTYVSGGTASIPVNIENPYTLADLPNLRWAQSADVLNVVVGTQPLYQLTRVTQDSFTYTAPTLLFGPFQDLNTDGTTTVYASATQGTVTLTASAPIFKPAHVGALFSLQEQFLDSISAWEAQKNLIDGSGTPVGTYLRSDSKIYLCVDYLSSTGDANFYTGTFQPVHTSGTQMDGNGGDVPTLGSCGVSWQFVSTDTGVALITEYIDAQHVKAEVQSYKGVYSNFPPTVVGGPQTVVGPFTFSGNGTTATFTPLTSITNGNPNQFYVTVGGVFQDPSTFSINQSATSITFFTPPVAGTSNIVVTQVTGTLTNIYDVKTGALVPLTGLCLSTYWALGSISHVQGYASDVCYYNDRLVLAGTTLQPQTLFTSQVSDYLNFGVSSPQIDSDAITETINSRQQNPINNLLPMNNLLLGTASASWRVTDSSGIGAITPTNISLIPQEFYGMHNVPAIQTGTTIIYVQWGGRKLRDILYQFYNDKFYGQELTVFARQMFPFGTECTRAAFSPEPYGLIYCVRSDGVMCVCSYLPEQQMLAWTRYITTGNFEDVCVVPENNSYSVYVIVGRTINGAYQRYIERFASREFSTNNDAFFVDSGLTYDGRNTSSTTMTVSGGTTWLAQDTGIVSASSTSGWDGFASTDPGNNNAIWLNDANGNRLCRLQITAYISSSGASVKFLDPVPAAVQGIPNQNWTFARTTFGGLTNLVNQTVSVYADGATMPQQTVSVAGSITLPNAGGVVHAGLPYTYQMQGMNLNQQNQPSIRNVAKRIERLSVVVDESFPFYVGPDFDHLDMVPLRDFETYGQPITPHTGVVNCQMPAYWSDDLTVCIQGSDPVPVTILGWMASLELGEPG